jgi:hypothetical protein
MVSPNFQVVFELLLFQIWKISQNIARKTRFQQLITEEELENPSNRLTRLHACSFCKLSNYVSHACFLEMYLKFRVSRSPRRRQTKTH